MPHQAKKRSRADHRPEVTVHQRKASFAAWAVLGVSLLTTTTGWWFTRTHFKQHLGDRMAVEARDVRDVLADQITQTGEALSGLRAHMAASSSVVSMPPWHNDSPALADFDHPGVLQVVVVRPSRPSRSHTPLSNVEVQEVWAAPGQTDVRGIPRSYWSRAITRITPHQVEPTLTLLKQEGRSESLAVLLPPSSSQGGVEPQVEQAWPAALIDLNVLVGEATKAIGGAARVELFAHDGDQQEPRRVVETSVLTDSTTADLAAVTTFKLGGGSWSIQAQPLGGRLPFSDDYSLQFLLGGLAMSILLFDMALMVDSRRAEAAAVSELMTRRLRESESRIRAVVDHAPDGIVTFDGAGSIATFNPGAERVFGYPAAEVRGRSIGTLLPSWWPSDDDHIRSFLTSLDGDVMSGGEEVEGLRKDKTTVPTELTVSRMASAKRPMFTAIIRDVSERKETQEALRRSEERYALAAWASNDGLWDWNVETEQVFYSPRWKSMLGFEDSDIVGRPSEWIHRLHADDRDHFQKTLRAHLDGDTPHFEVEYRIRHRDGTYRWMLCKGVAVRDEQQQPLRLAGSQTDITSRKKVELQLMRDALYDSLTGLPNRSHFLRVLRHVVEDSRHTPDEMFALLFLDLDRFKHVNDSLGHHVGDQLLVGIADRLKRVLRSQETLARLGGDEFAILVEGLQEAGQAARIAERIQQELSHPFMLDEHEIFVSVSIGIAVRPEREETPEGLIRDADTAMYRAKAAGKGRHALFDQSMHIQAVERLSLETSLRRAVERKEFVLHYQPFVSLESGRITGCEALVRWNHPTRGLVSPMEFIPVSEEMGLINPLGAWILEEACRQMKTWHNSGLPKIRLAVNLSPRQCRHPDLVETVLNALRRSGLENNLLQLEITESALMENADEIIDPLVQLYEMGIQFSLDDFGAGYSSLTYLQRFPIQTLKIDGSFVQEATGDPEGAALASGLMALGHTLGLRVICEGVETEQQFQFLANAGKCDEVQGYYLSRPLAPENFAQLLASEQETATFSHILSRSRTARSLAASAGADGSTGDAL